MSYIRVLVPKDVSEDFADEMARTGKMQLSDLNEDMQSFDRPQMRTIIRLQAVEQQINSIEKELVGYGVLEEGDMFVCEEDLQATPRTTHGKEVGCRVDVVEEGVKEAYQQLSQQAAAEKNLSAQFDDERMTLDTLCNFLKVEREGALQAEKTFRENHEQRKQADNSLYESLLHATRAPSRDNSEAVGMEELKGGVRQGPRGVGFKFISGIVSEERRISFERQVYLITRGNSYTMFEVSPSDETRYTYMVYYLGERIGATLRRLCRSMNVSIYLESDESTSVDARRLETERKMKELDRILHHTQRDLKTTMGVIATKIKLWKIAVNQEKAIRVVLNLFKHEKGSILRAEGWCPTRSIDSVQQALEVATRGKGMAPTVVEEIDAEGRKPPTHFEQNKFTQAFQVVIDTYGIPRYREYNPTVPSIITFPFLFAMMYGDVFHGGVVFLIALYVVLNENKWKGKQLNELFEFVYNGRYLLLLMGTFAVYTGLIYNDCLSIGMTIWSKSSWDDNIGWTGVYPFGIDPAWHGRGNQIEFTNSVKMKMSVLFGVTQMTFGLVLKMLNHIQEGDQITLIWEFIPQLVFMFTFFVYMCFIIIYKWVVNWALRDYQPPSLITVLVNMVLAPGQVTEETRLFLDADWQGTIQLWLVAFMMLSIPIMLLCKPLILRCKYGGQSDDHAYVSVVDDEGEDETEADGAGSRSANKRAKKESGDAGGGHGHGHGGKFDFGEVMIHQMIHTIEYVLGTVSNTASYLRLWALSLAHAQLSEVFYHKTILEMLTGSGVSVFIGITCFFGVTFAVLIVMDQLECFLHALRLHWVEFQNKFYYADGVKFEPFSYKQFVAKRD